MEHGGAVKSSHAKDRPFSMWRHVAGLAWSRTESRDLGGRWGALAYPRTSCVR
jgi:hypothetical protein